MLLYSHFNHLSTTAVPTFNLHLVVATAAAATATVVTTIVYCYFCSHCYCALETSHALQDLNSTCSSRSHRHTILYHEVGCKTFSFLLWKKKRIKVTRGCVLENRDRNTKYILRLAATDHFFLLSSCDKKGGTRREKKRRPRTSSSSIATAPPPGPLPLSVASRSAYPAVPFPTRHQDEKGPGHDRTRN